MVLYTFDIQKTLDILGYMWYNRSKNGGNKMKKTLSIPQTLIDMLEKEATKQKTTQSTIMVMALAEYFNKLYGGK